MIQALFMSRSSNSLTDAPMTIAIKRRYISRFMSFMPWSLPMTSSLRKRVASVARWGKNTQRGASLPPGPLEAYDYEDDVTPEAIAQLRAEADEVLSKGEWTTIEGYVGTNKQTPRVG